MLCKYDSENIDIVHVCCSGQHGQQLIMKALVLDFN